MRLGFCLTLLLGCFAAWGGSAVSERALLAVVDLAETAEKNKWLYRLEGKAAVRRIHRLADEKYGEVIVHDKKKATITHFLTSLKSLLESPSVNRIDVVIYLHGKNPESETGASVCFVGASCLPMVDLAKKIRDLSGENAWKLRMLYSDACWGNSTWMLGLRQAFEWSMAREV